MKGGGPTGRVMFFLSLEFSIKFPAVIYVPHGRPRWRGKFFFFSNLLRAKKGHCRNHIDSQEPQSLNLLIGKDAEQDAAGIMSLTRTH